MKVMETDYSHGWQPFLLVSGNEHIHRVRQVQAYDAGFPLFDQQSQRSWNLHQWWLGDDDRLQRRAISKK